MRISKTKPKAPPKTSASRPASAALPSSRGRRGRKKGVSGGSMAPEPPETPPEPDPGSATDARGRRPSRLARLLHVDGINDQTILTSTRQAEAVNPAVVATHPPQAGPDIGVDIQTNNGVSADPHELYAQERITSPNVAILGAVGSAKSSLIKTTHVARAVATGKQVAVFDRKSQQDGRGRADHGEYEGVAAACGDWAQVFTFDRSEGAAINLLDPRIASTSDKESGTVGQDSLLRLAAEYAHGPLTSRERYALRAAHKAALAQCRAEDRVATLGDVIEALYAPGPEAVPREHLAQRGLVTVDDLTRWGLDLAVDLERFVDGDLSGLVDATTTEGVDWSAPLLVFDTSELEENSPALSLVMAVVSTFLSSVWARSGPRRRVIIVEEGYYTASLQAAGGVSVAGILRSLVKRGRGIGLAFVTAVHHLSDLPADSDAMSLIREAGVVHIYLQDRDDDIEAALRSFNVPRWVDLSTLERGEHVLKIGSEPARLVKHIRTAAEVEFTDTDGAMLARGPSPVEEEVES